MSLLVVGLSAVGCSSARERGPLVVCGKTVAPGGNPGPLEVDAWARNLASPDAPERAPVEVTMRGGQLLRVSDSCDTGSTVTFDPPAAVSMADPVVLAADHRPVMFSLTANTPSAAVTITVKGQYGTRVLNVRLFDGNAPIAPAEPSP